MTGAGARMAPHVPVLVDEVVAALAVQAGDIAADRVAACHRRRDRSSERRRS